MGIRFCCPVEHEHTHKRVEEPESQIQLFKKYAAKYKNTFPQRFAPLSLSAQKLQQANLLLSLPIDILIYTFQFLSVRELATKLPTICKYINAVATHESLWKCIHELRDSIPVYSCFSSNLVVASSAGSIASVKQSIPSYRLLCLENHLFCKAALGGNSQIQYQHPPAKIAFVGDTHVGKSHLLESYKEMLRGGLLPLKLEYIKTIGFDLHIVTFPEERLKMQLWDTAGDPRFRSVNNMIRFHVIAYCFDLSNKQSFTLVKQLFNQYNSFMKNSLLQQILIGLKADLVTSKSSVSRQVSTIEAEELCKELGLKEYVEISSYREHDVKFLMETLILRNVLHACEGR